MSTARGYSSTRDARELDSPPAGPAPGSGRPHAAEEVRVLRLRPHDRLAVTVDLAGTTDADVVELRDSIASWAGLDPDRVILLSGVDVAVVRQEQP